MKDEGCTACVGGEVVNQRSIQLTRLNMETFLQLANNCRTPRIQASLYRIMVDSDCILVQLAELVFAQSQPK